MGFFERLFETTTAQPAVVAVDPALELRGQAAQVVALVNRSGDVLPTIGSALARRVTDALDAILSHENWGHLGPHAVITLRGVTTSYLPDAITTYVAAARAGHADDVALMQQLTALHHAVVAVLVAARDGDVAAMEAQHAFLVTKFTGSDLDL